MKSLAHCILLAGALSLANLSPANADELADVKASGQLVCGTLGTFEPFSFVDQKTREIVGYEVDLCQGIADALGVKLKLKPIAVEARIPELMQGRVDVISAALGYSDERAKQIAFSTTIFVSRIMLLVRTSSDITQLDQINDKKISAPKGTSAEKFIRTLYPNANILTFQDPPAAFLALKQSKVSALILNELASTKLIRGDEKSYLFVKQPVALEPWGIGLRKDEPRMLAAVDGALKQMEASGKGKAIFDKWLGSDASYKLQRSFTLDTPVSNPILKPAL